MKKAMPAGRQGFTIIEILVVTGITVLMIPILFTVVFAVIRQEARVYALNTVKNQGDFILNTMKFNIRNYAISVHDADLNSVCTTASSTPVTMNPLVLRDRDGNSFYFSVSGNSIASNSSVLASPVTLSNSQVQITNFSMGCNLSSLYSAPIITVSYTVNFISQAAGDLAASLQYNTKIKLRNQ